MESFGVSAGIVSHLSQSQQNNMQANNFLPQASNGQGTEIGGTGVGILNTFQSHMQENVSLSAKQQALIMGSGIRNYSFIPMEEQLPEELGLHGLVQLPSPNVQTAVQPQFHGSMTLGFEGESDSNSALTNVESNSTGRLCQDNFTSINSVDGLLGRASFNSGRAQLRAPKRIDMLPSVLLYPDIVGHSGDSSASARPLAHSNWATEIDSDLLALINAGVGHVSYKGPTFPSANIQMSVSDTRKPSNVSRSMSETNIDTGRVEGLSNWLLPHLGDYGLSTFEAHGIDHKPWHADILAKDMPDFFQNSLVDNLNSVKESSKDSEAGFGELSATADDCDESCGNGLKNFKENKHLPPNGLNNTGNSISPLPAGAKLFEALEPAFKKGPDMGIWDEILFPREDACNANLGTPNFKASAESNCPSEVDIAHGLNAYIDMGYERCFLSETKSKDLLDSLVANVCPPVNKSTDNNISGKSMSSGLTSTSSLYCTSVRSDLSSAGRLNGCEQKQSKAAGISQFRTNADLVKGTNPVVTSESDNVAAVKRHPNEPPSKRLFKSWVDEHWCENPGLAQAKWPGEPTKVNRKRLRPGEASRPRPKDRQQIQDRVRELRDIVPNGAKCSIDALLERTIKHMLFLQSVTKYADKPKQSGESKVHDTEGALLATNNLEGGASWAFELDGQTVACPIIVEDLNQPRQMLVEMLCEEWGLFLEIADMIRSLGLTILKGVIEARKDKIWSCFVVEANRDIHRLEILWPLLQLLQPNNKSSSTTTDWPT